jgi:hypothetical protein
MPARDPFDYIGRRFSGYLLGSSTRCDHTAHYGCREMNIAELAGKPFRDAGAFSQVLVACTRHHAPRENVCIRALQVTAK